MKKVAILILFMLGCAISEGYAQKVALKSNLLYDATTTMNLGLEIGLVCQRHRNQNRFTGRG